MVGKIILVTNLKGGVGKSTIAVNLACGLRTTKNKVVLIDGDVQRTTIGWDALSSLPVEVVPLPLDSEKEAARWKQDVREISADIIVIDCPPHIGAATEAAVELSDLVLVPVTASVADMVATFSAVNLIKKVRETRTDGGPEVFMVPSRIDKRTRLGRELPQALKNTFGLPVAPSIGQRSVFADLYGEGWIGDFAPGSIAHDEVVALVKSVKGILK